jgi:hypothetical protein
MKKRNNTPETPRPSIGTVMIDSISREWCVITSGSFDVLCRQVLADGTISKADVILSLVTLQPAGRKLTVRIEDLVR